MSIKKRKTDKDTTIKGGEEETTITKDNRIDIIIVIIITIDNIKDEEMIIEIETIKTIDIEIIETIEIIEMLETGIKEMIDNEIRKTNKHKIKTLNKKNKIKSMMEKSIKREVFIQNRIPINPNEISQLHHLQLGVVKKFDKNLKFRSKLKSKKKSWNNKNLDKKIIGEEIRGDTIVIIMIVVRTNNIKEKENKKRKNDE